MNITNRLNLPAPLVDAVMSDYTPTENRYSVTTLLKGTKEIVLSRRHFSDIEEDVSERIWAIFGSAVHKILEESKETDTQIKENKIVAPVPGTKYELSGIFDLYDEKTKTVTDYKTASTWKVIFQDFDDWRTQTLAYCYLLRSIGFEANHGEVVAILKDHSKTKAKHDANYPQYPVVKIDFDFTPNDFAHIEAHILDKFRDIEAAEKLADDDIEPCSQAERWQEPCKFAVMKQGAKRAYRVFESLEMAEDCAEAQTEATGKTHTVEYRPSIPKKCAEYCSVCEWCNFYQSYMHNEEKEDE